MALDLAPNARHTTDNICVNLSKSLSCPWLLLSHLSNEGRLSCPIYTGVPLGERTYSGLRCYCPLPPRWPTAVSAPVCTSSLNQDFLIHTCQPVWARGRAHLSQTALLPLQSDDMVQTRVYDPKFTGFVSTYLPFSTTKW